ALRQRLAATHVVARWPRSGGGLRSAGLLHAWSPHTESSAEVLEHLTAQLATSPRGRGRRTGRTGEPVPGGRSSAGGRSRPLAGRRVAVQLHAEPHEQLCAALAAAGAEVIEVPAYRWAPPVDPAPLHRLVDLITNNLVDAVTFSSAVAV